MDPQDFLKLAKDVVAHQTEASFRTSISRSYYAVYNYFCNACGCFGVDIPKNPSGHEMLIANFYNSGIKDAADIGRIINDLRSQRIKADYNLDYGETARTAEFVYKKADRIIQNYCAIDKDALKKGMLAFREQVRNL